MEDQEKIRDYFHKEEVVVEHTPNKGLHDFEETLIKKYIENVSRILDIGCGAGRISNYLANRGNEVVGTDFSEKMIKKAKELSNSGNPRYICKDFTDTELEEKSFDYVIIINTMKHILGREKRLKVLEKGASYLKPTGELIFSIPSFFRLDVIKKNLSALLNQKKGSNGKAIIYRGKLPYQIPPPWGLRELLRKSKLKVKEITTFPSLKEKGKLLREIYDLFWIFFYQYWITKKETSGDLNGS